MRNLLLIAHNLRSCHNVGSLLRTADGLGISKVYLTGYTPYPAIKNDPRLPHVAQKLHKQIQKTALGAEQTVDWTHSEDIDVILAELKSKNFEIIALEQAKNSTQIDRWIPSSHTALVLGRETEGIEREVLMQCDKTIEIPMFGEKESFNVVQAGAMALFYSRFAK